MIRTKSFLNINSIKTVNGSASRDKALKNYFRLKTEWGNKGWSVCRRNKLAQHLFNTAVRNDIYVYRRTNHFSPSKDNKSGTGLKQGSKPINLGSNDYLGFSQHPQVVKAGTHALQKYGVGAGSVPMLTGTYDIHKLLETRFAQFTGYESSLLFNSGYAANIGVLECLVGPNDAVIMDTLVHASLLNSSHKGKTFFFIHNDPASLVRSLEKASSYENIIVVLEGIYSMDGDMGKIDTISSLAKGHGAVVMVDDAHGIGVNGPNGKGTVARFNMNEQVDIITGSFGKALAGIGGFVCGSKAFIHYLEMMSNPFLYSSSLPPAIVASILCELQLLEQHDPALGRLWKNTRKLAAGLSAIGYDIGATESPIIPVLIPNEEKVIGISKELEKYDIIVNPIFYPVVPKRKARLRVSVNASLSTTDIDYTLNVFEELYREYT